MILEYGDLIETDRELNMNVDREMKYNREIDTRNEDKIDEAKEIKRMYEETLNKIDTSGFGNSKK